MSEVQWFACKDPDLLLEAVEGKVSRQQLVAFVRQCWQRITPYLPPIQSNYTVVEEFAVLAPEQSNHDATLYASEAALKAARWAPALQEERGHQAELLRRIVGRPS